jgi:hypothetical protein
MDDGKERRRQPRIAWRGSVKLTINSGDLMEATIADISEVGCGFRTDRAIEPGQRVVIDGTGFHGDGFVRYCYPHAGAFRIGVELQPN